MTPEQVERIFNKFYRVDNSDSDLELPGLGMTIVKHIVDAHNGSILIDSICRTAPLGSVCPW